MKKRTKVFLICCVSLAIVSEAVACYFQVAVLGTVAASIIGACMGFVLHHYCC